MILALAFAAPPSNAIIERTFEKCLQRAPLHGHQFREGVIFALRKLNIDLGKEDEPFYNTISTHPEVRWVGPYYGTLNVMLSKQGGKVKAQCLPNITEYFRVSDYFLSNRKLLAIYRQGGSGISLRGVVYNNSAAGWRQVYSLDEKYELSMQGYNLNIHGLRGSRGLAVEFTDHEMFDRHFWGSHFAPALKFEEKWLFANGVLRRTVFRQVMTPTATLYNIKVAADKGFRREFDSMVPRRFRATLWRALCSKKGYLLGSDPRDEPIADYDDCKDLIVGESTEIHFKRRRGAWVVSSVEPYKVPEA